MSELIKSRIELFPDELWLEVFAYTTPFDLYDAWRNLNTHINAILRSVRIGIVIGSANKDAISYQKILEYFSSQIIHIRDQRSNITDSSPNRSIDFLSLVNIRSLDLARCSKETLEPLINHHQLTRLSLPCDCSTDFFQRYVLGTDGEKRFPNLRFIGRIWYLHMGNTNSSSFSPNRIIEHVHLVIPSSSYSTNIPQYFPNINTITIDYLGNENVYTWPCTIIAKIRRHSNDGLSNILSKMNSSSPATDQKKSRVLTIVESIFRLEVDFEGHCDFVKLSQILRLCPILQHLQIRVKYYPTDIDLISIRNISPFFATLDFGDIQKETGKPVIIAKWSS